MYFSHYILILRKFSRQHSNLNSRLEFMIADKYFFLIAYCTVVSSESSPVRMKISWSLDLFIMANVLELDLLCSSASSLALRVFGPLWNPRCVFYDQRFDFRLSEDIFGGFGWTEIAVINGSGRHFKNAS